MPKVSVIVCIHNAGHYLRPLLNSIIRQTLTDIEILLIDDGSTDGSRDIIKEYQKKDQRVQVFFRDQSPNENFGQKYSADLGRKHAVGEYIIIVDHDDELMLNALETLYSYTDNGTVDVVQGRSIAMSSDTDEILWYTPNFWNTPTTITSIKNLSTVEIYKHLVYAPVALWICLIKNDFQKDIELIDAVGNDNNFIWKCKLLANSYCYIPKYLYINYRHNDSVAGLDNYNKYYLEIFKVFDDLREFINNHQFDFNIQTIYSIYSFQTLLGCFNTQLTEDHALEYLNKFQTEINNNVNILDILTEEYQESYISIKNGTFKEE